MSSCVRGFTHASCESVYYEVVALGLEEKIDGEPFYGVWSDGSFFVMGRLEEGE